MAGVPEEIQRFVDATNAGDTAAFLECFAENAFLSDWGREFTGRAGVSRWNDTDNIGVHSHLLIRNVVPNGHRYQLLVIVNGDGFNGDGTMTFTLADGRISRLEIS
jgi:hypothetical protein